MFYKKNLFVAALTFTVFLMTIFTNAQTIIVVLKQPPPNEWHVEYLWELTLTNTLQESHNVYLYGTVEEADAGIIFEGTTTSFTLEPNYSGPVYQGDLEPVDVGYVNDDYEDIVQKTGTLPAGTYTICVYVKSVDGEDMGYDCKMQIIAHPSPPELINPVDEANVTDELPVFLWLPPMPMSDFVSYTIKIVELLDGQIPIEAMEANPVFYIEEDIPATSFQFPISARPFESGINYAWKVTAISGYGLVIGESPVWSFNYEAAVVVLYEEPDSLELVSPVNGEEISDTELLFEWMPIDTTLVTLAVTPEVSYNLKIWQLTEDLVERIIDGYILIQKDFIDIEEALFIEGITITSFAQDQYFLEMEVGSNYAWQVIAIKEGNLIGHSEISMFTFGSKIIEEDTLNPGISFALNVIHINLVGKLDKDPIKRKIQKIVKKKIIEEPIKNGICGAPDTSEAKIYKVTYELDSCKVARGKKPGGGLNTTFTFYIKRTIFFKWRFRYCMLKMGHGGKHKFGHWSKWQSISFDDAIIKTKTIGGCPTAMSSTYFKRWLKEFAIADLKAQGLGNMKFNGFFGDFGKLCKKALKKAKPCKGKKGKKVKQLVNAQGLQGGQGIQSGQGVHSGVGGCGNAGGCASGIIKCGLIGFEIGGSGLPNYGFAVYVKGLPGSVPPRAKIEIDIPVVGIFEMNADKNGGFIFDKNTANVTPFFVRVKAQNNQGNWSPVCIVDGTTPPFGKGKAGTIKCNLIKFYQDGAIPTPGYIVRIKGDPGAVPNNAEVRICIPSQQPVWVVAEQNGSFVFSMNTGLIIPKFAYVKFLDNSGNLCQLCTLYPGQGAMSGIPITQNIDCRKISFSTRGRIPSPGIIVDVVGLAGSVDSSSQVRIDIPLAGTFWVQAAIDGSFQFSKNVGNIIIPHQVEVGGVDAQGNFNPKCIVTGLGAPGGNSTQNIDCSKISFSTRGGIPLPGIIVDVVGLAGSVDSSSQVRIDIPLAGTFWVQAAIDGSFQFSKNVGNIIIPHQVEVGGVDAQGNFNPTCVL